MRWKRLSKTQAKSQKMRWPRPDPRTGGNYMRFVDPVNLELTAATQGFYQEDGGPPQVLHWGSNMQFDHDDQEEEQADNHADAVRR
jgi:hypothetical protein